MAKFTIAPWLDLRDMKEKMDRLMEEAHAREFRSGGHSEMPALWQPATDVFETPEDFVIQVELPGLAPEEVSLEVRDGEIWIYGERRFEKEAGGSVYQILERSYGPFARRFRLPDGVDLGQVKAVFRNGLLTVTVPKRAARTEGRRIEIRIL